MYVTAKCQKDAVLWLKFTLQFSEYLVEVVPTLPNLLKSFRVIGFLSPNSDVGQKSDGETGKDTAD